jgi:ABC-type branched-subunit amino acid transport system substrate-binding protein
LRVDYPSFGLGAPVPLTGRYAAQGAQLRAGLELWARQARVRLVVEDDHSDPALAARLHEQLVRRCRLVLGPYGSDSTRAVARAAGAVWNHGGAADDVQCLPGVVSVPSPASRYLVALGRAVAELRPGARVAVIAASGRFAASAHARLEREAPHLGIGLVRAPERADAVLLCGPLEWELEQFRRIGPRPLLGGVSPGLAAFADLLGGDPEGFLAPVQWHPDLHFSVELGPERVALDDYVAAQAYAAALVAAHCLELAPDAPFAAAHRLTTTTFFGRFELDPASGLQRGHRLAVVRWRRGKRVLLLREAA